MDTNQISVWTEVDRTIEARVSTVQCKFKLLIMFGLARLHISYQSVTKTFLKVMSFIILEIDEKTT